MAEAGSREEDVYFSTVPSQKSTLSALATITEQLLWLGGPGLGSPHPAWERRPACPEFTPQCAKTGGRCTQKCLHPRVCIRWKLCKIMEFFSTLVAAMEQGCGFLNLHAAGCMRPSYLQNNRWRDVHDLACRALAAELHWSPPLSCTFAPYKYTLVLKGDNHLVWDKSSLHQSNLSPRGDVTPNTNAYEAYLLAKPVEKYNR